MDRSPLAIALALALALVGCCAAGCNSTTEFGLDGPTPVLDRTPVKLDTEAKRDVGVVKLDKGRPPDGPRPAPDTKPQADQLAPKLDKGQADAGPCAAGESFYGGHCYRITGIKYISWDTAKTMCGAQTPAMKIATISSAGENQFVYSQLPPLNQTAWMGLKRVSPGSPTFAWDSGEPVSYLNWAVGEPSNSGGAEDCVIMWGPHISVAGLASKWNDTLCADPAAKVDAVICERVP